MSLESLDNDALRELQSEQAQLLDVIDELRSLQLGHLVELPQLIVCGDQSSGKSSVLEAISRVRFPVKGGVCTRFATEVILRRKARPSFKITIEPGPSRTNEQERTRFRNFAAGLLPETPLEKVIDEAKKMMGIALEDKKFGGFSDDVLKIEICGPDKPGLTLVDLPGLYHAKSKEQGADGIPIVRSLVKSYMRSPRSIILAVISAKNEYNNQEILDLAQTYDQKYERTLAIVTKPDTLPRNSDEEQSYIELVNNEHIKLQLGWHTLRNRDYDTRDASDEARDEQEREFFSEEPWTNIPRELVGIDTLRPRLSSMLLDHISRNLPALVSDIEKKICDRQRRLDQLGDERATTLQKRAYLLGVSGQFEKITAQAINGMYLDTFFGGLYATTPGILDFKRLRAVIRELNESFALEMMERGARRRIIREPEDDKNQGERAPPEGQSDAPAITIEELEKEIGEMARKNRGIELPGTSNQLLVGGLFRDQCKPWETIAQTHLTKVWQAIQKFTELLLHHLSDKATYRPLLGTVLSPALETMNERAMEKLRELVSYHNRGHPLPFDSNFLEEMEGFRQERLMTVLGGALLEKHPDGIKGQIFSMQDIEDAADEFELYRDQFAAGEVIDLMEVYYGMALKTFIDNVAILAVENCLIAPLESIFTPLTVNAMEQEEIDRLATEPVHVQRNRDQFRSDLSKLNAALKICKQHTRTTAYVDPQVDSMLKGKGDWNELLTKTGTERLSGSSAMPRKVLPVRTSSPRLGSAKSEGKQYPVKSTGEKISSGSVAGSLFSSSGAGSSSSVGGSGFGAAVSPSGTRPFGSSGTGVGSSGRGFGSFGGSGLFGAGVSPSGAGAFGSSGVGVNSSGTEPPHPSLAGVGKATNALGSLPATSQSNNTDPATAFFGAPAAPKPERGSSPLPGSSLLGPGYQKPDPPTTKNGPPAWVIREGLENWQFISICAHPQYADYSPEELRVVDYAREQIFGGA